MTTMTNFAANPPLRFGLFHGPHHATSLDPTYAFERDLLLMEHLDRLGFDEARLSVGCYSRPTIETAITSVRSPAGVVAAGRHGAGVLVLGGIDDAALTHHAANWRIYEETAARHGHAADRANWRVTMFMHLA